MKKKAKKYTLNSLNALYEGREMFLNAFKSGIFQLLSVEVTGNSDMLPHVAQLSDCKVSEPTSLSILNSKQMFQRLLIAPAQVKVGNTENILNEIDQIICSLYQAKEITKRVCNNIMNPIKL